LAVGCLWWCLLGEDDFHTTCCAICRFGSEASLTQTKTPENTETFSSQVETKRFRAKANPRVHENYS